LPTITWNSSAASDGASCAASVPELEPEPELDVVASTGTGIRLPTTPLDDPTPPDDELPPDDEVETTSLDCASVGSEDGPLLLLPHDVVAVT
jgi:hypothetical protein